MTRIIAVAACDHALLRDPLPLLRQCAALGVWAVELRVDYLPDAWLPESLRGRPGLGDADRWPEGGEADWGEFLAGDGPSQDARYSIGKWILFHIRRAWKDELAVRHGLPRLIATARRQADTGLFPDDEHRARFALLRECFEAGCDLVDVEADVAKGCLLPEYYRLIHSISDGIDTSSLRMPGEQTRYRIICSRHLPDGCAPTREEVSQQFMKLPDGSDVAKASPGTTDTGEVRHKNLEPWIVRKLACSLQTDPSIKVHEGFWTIPAPQGGLGGGLRWFADRLDWMGVYLAAPLSRLERPSLPGVERIRRLLRFELPSGDGPHMPMFSSSFAGGGVIGSGASRSLSPLIHNALAANPNCGLRYAPLQTDKLMHGVSAARNVRHAKDTLISITNPFKEEAAVSPDFSCDQIAKDLGAANTARHQSYMGGEGNPFQATNTDVGGFLAALRARRSDERLARDRVLVYGYGGSARAVLYALRDKAGAVFVTGRNAAKGKAVAMQFGAAWHPSPESDDSGFDVVVNATPCGQPGGDQAGKSPCDLSRLELNPGALVFDLVYGTETPLARQAKAIGVEFEDGLNMLLEQAYLQQVYWGLRSGRPSNETHALLRGACRRASRGQPWTPPLRIALIGYRGAGKTTVAGLLGAKLGIPHTDLDDRVAWLAGFSRDAAAAFTTLGEAAFREMEGQTLRELSSLPVHMGSKTPNIPALLSCGGGVVEGSKSLINLVEGFTVIELRARPETLLGRMAGDTSNVRPPLEPGRSPAQELAIRMARREPWHRAIADFEIDTDGKTPEQVADEAARWIFGE